MHRIGQHQATTVWMYIVEDTVEKSIYDISVTRRLAHMGRYRGTMEKSEDAGLESKIDAANSMEMEETALAKVLTKGSSGGEVVGKEDLWNCLFQHRPGHSGTAHEAGREVVRPLGVSADEGRLDLNGQSASSV